MNFESIDKFFIIPRKEIYYFNFILESYEHFGFVTTIDKFAAKIKVTISPFFINEFNNLIQALKKEMEITEL